MLFSASFCGSVKCKNDGECNSGISSFTCICVGGFLGTTCERKCSLLNFVIVFVIKVMIVE